MSDRNSNPVVRIGMAIVLVVSGLFRAIGAALLFGHWCFGVGLLLGLLVGGVMALTMAGRGTALIFGPLVGAGIGAATGAVFGLVAGAFFPGFVDRVAQHPMFNFAHTRSFATQAKQPIDSKTHAREEASFASTSQQSPPTSHCE